MVWILWKRLRVHHQTFVQVYAREGISSAVEHFTLIRGNILPNLPYPAFTQTNMPRQRQFYVWAGDERVRSQRLIVSNVALMQDKPGKHFVSAHMIIRRRGTHLR